MYPSDFLRRSWVEIDLNQISINLKSYCRNLPDDCEIIAVVKANAYGHGDCEVAHFLSTMGVKNFAVSNIDEAITLRNDGITGEILILGYTPKEMTNLLVKYDLTQTLLSEDYAEIILSGNPDIKCQFAIDTGMNRIGLNASFPDECERIIRKYASRCKLTGIFTHLCVADSKDKSDIEFTKQQIDKFQRVADSVQDLSLPFVHCYNSAGGQEYAYYGRYNRFVRLGIVLYGLKPSSDIVLASDVHPALKWKTVVSMVKTVNPGEYVGYGRSFRAGSVMKLATLPTGYADGLSRRLSNGVGYVMVNGVRAPIVGRICMDQTMVDVTDIENVTVGDEVEIIGDAFSADDMAEKIGTIGYEIICGISKRVPRVYIK